jgi:hypothetical protein
MQHQLHSIIAFPLFLTQYIGLQRTGWHGHKTSALLRMYAIDVTVVNNDKYCSSKHREIPNPIYLY